MREYINSWGVEFKVGDIGKMHSKFKSKDFEPAEVKIISFTPAGKYMRCEETAELKDKKYGKKIVYLFSTESQNLKGSHMGRTYVRFDK